MSDNTQPTVVDELDVNPEEDFKDTIAPPGWYDADVSSCTAKTYPLETPSDAPDWLKQRSGMTEVRVVYRLQHPDNQDLNGLSLSGMGANFTMIVNQGKNYGWKKWLEAMGMPTEGENYKLRPADFQGLPVQVRLGTKPIKTKEGPRTVNTVEAIKKRDAVA